MISIQILIAIISFGFLIFFHELFHYLAARAVGIKPKEFAIGFGKSFLVYQRKKFYFWPKKGSEEFDLDEISYHIKLLPLGGYVLFERPIKNEKGEMVIKGDYQKIHPLKRIFVSVAGPIGNFLLAFILMMVLFTPYMSPNPDGKVVYVKENSIAETIGIQPQDRIVRFNDKDIKSLKVVSEYVQSQESLCIKWESGKSTKTECVDNNKEKIGVTFSMSIWQGIVFTWNGFIDLIQKYIVAFFEVLLHLDIKDFNGPIGTLDAIQQSVPVWENFIGILVLINIALGSVNLLMPLTVTDGGKIIVDLISLMRGKRSIDTKYLDLISFALVASLFVITFFLDIHRIIDRIL
ncbi:M50 family metallopeptidase [[Brevibacterium] frigoritolerans]|nr:M50 family metallopeptidase [Peribacillus frigoritolerans]